MAKKKKGVKACLARDLEKSEGALEQFGGQSR